MSDNGSETAELLDELQVEIATEPRVPRSELVRAIHTYIQEALPNSSGGCEEYQAGVSAAVAAILDRCLEAIVGVDWSGPTLAERTVQRTAGASMRFAAEEAAAARTAGIAKLRPRELHGSVEVNGSADRPLLAAVLESESLQASLWEFLAPLRSRPDGGAGLLRTLRAYLDAECNISSAASALKVRRQTVGNRLRLAEQLLGRPLRSCLGELDVALRLADLHVGRQSSA